MPCLKCVDENYHTIQKLKVSCNNLIFTYLCLVDCCSRVISITLYAMVFCVSNECINVIQSFQY